MASKSFLAWSEKLTVNQEIIIQEKLNVSCLVYYLLSSTLDVKKHLRISLWQWPLTMVYRSHGDRCCFRITLSLTPIIELPLYCANIKKTRCVGFLDISFHCCFIINLIYLIKIYFKYISLTIMIIIIIM